MDKTSRASEGYLFLIIAVFTWSFTEIIVKLLHGSVGPFSLSFFRFFLGGVFLFCVLILKKDLKGISKMIKDNLPLILISSSFAFGFANIIYFIGVTFTQANIASTIYTTYPIWITIYSIFILNERSNLKLKFIGIAFGIVGVAILMTDFNLIGIFSAEYILGNGLVLIGSIIWGLYSVIGKKIQLNEKETTNCSLKFGFVSLFLACIPVLIFLPFTAELQGFLKYNIEAWLWILFLGIISTGIGTYLLFEGVNRVEVSKGFSVAFLKPIFTTILAFFILLEVPSSILLVSISLVMIHYFNHSKSLKEK